MLDLENKQTNKHYTLMGPTAARLVRDPLVVLHKRTEYVCMYLFRSLNERPTFLE